MSKVVIVHGYGAYPQKNWFPWLKAELEKQGHTVFVPAMPHTDTPQLKEWLAHLRKLVGQADESVYLVGHSLGCPTILRYLEALPVGQKVGGAILVAGFAQPIKLSELDSFTAPAWDDEKIKTSAGSIVLISSDNDPYIPLEMAQSMGQRFDAELQVLHNAGHINHRDGYTQAPFVTDALQKMMVG